MNAPSFSRIWQTVAFFILPLLISCAQPASDLGLVDLDEAISKAADNIAMQVAIQNDPLKTLSALVGTGGKRNIVVDSMIDGASGQRTAFAVEVERRLVLQLTATHQSLSISPLSADSLKHAEFLLVGTVTIEGANEKGAMLSNAAAGIRIAVVSISAGRVIAQASARVRNSGFDTTPSGFDQDSPVVALDGAVRGYIATASASLGTSANPGYLKQLRAASAIAQGSENYSRGKFSEALTSFQTALSDGEQLRALNGSYLASVRLGKLDQAELYFGRIVNLGVGERNLGVKFLFEPKSSEFWADQKVSGLYDMWIRQIARGLEKASTCVDIVGHASRTGTEANNELLSAQRAAVIQRKLLAVPPRQLGNRTTTKGVGSREYLVGIATDDARDAVNRRVTFSFHNCP